MRIVAGGTLDLSLVGAYFILIHSAVHNSLEIIRCALYACRGIPVGSHSVERRESDPDRVVIPQVRADIEQPHVVAFCAGTGGQESLRRVTSQTADTIASRSVAKHSVVAVDTPVDSHYCTPCIKEGGVLAGLLDEQAFA